MNNNNWRKYQMRRIITLVCCFAVCFFLAAGWIGVIGSVEESDQQFQTGDINLLVKIDVEKNGTPLDYVSSIASRDKIIIFHKLQGKQENGNPVSLEFCGNNIKNFSEDCYSMDYNISLSVPAIDNNNNVQYRKLGCNSSINIKSGQPVCIFENNTYKVKLTITKK